MLLGAIYLRNVNWRRQTMDNLKTKSSGYTKVILGLFISGISLIVISIVFFILFPPAISLPHVSSPSLPTIEFPNHIIVWLLVVLAIIFIGIIIWKFIWKSSWSFSFQKLFMVIILIVALILVWFYYPAIKNWWSSRDSNQTSQASVTTDTHDNDQFSPEIITYGQVYTFQEGLWYKCPIGEQYYEAYASPGDNIEKYTSTTGVHWVRVQNQTDKVFFSQTPISSFPYN
jgi:hypothetical protein